MDRSPPGSSVHGIFQDMLLLPLSVLLLLTQPWRSLGAEMKIYSQKTLANGCNLVACSPPEGGLPGRDGQDGREDPRREKGDPDSPEPAGQAGRPRPAGPIGPKGDNGSAGEPRPKGDTGPPGPPGMPGPAGRKGSSGRQGSMGPPGTPGPKGETGPKGEAGAPGMQGSPGPAGLKGERGAPGETGAPGRAGAAEVDDLWQWVAVLERQLRRLQKGFSQYKKVVLFPDGLAVGEKIFKTAGAVKSYSDARQVCREAKGQLASPRSAAENEAVAQLVRAKNHDAFLGMNDISTEGRFTYSTGESLVYSNWANGEPNNNNAGQPENCVQIYSEGKWNDIPCSTELLVICEF
ncbi:unnamed protein product [Rangifer tarandus platyrhynchus]|uniref:Uncharacterized protein n=2 Tax=Rangifer tarandus platyrhynchus TaxID=3082113 RepID=A0AC60A2U3_RANTA